MKKHPSGSRLVFLTATQLGCMMWGFVNHSWTAILSTLCFAIGVTTIYLINVE